jgi:hypothetical protein
MMNPMDNTQFIAQMATFSTLTAINNLADQSFTTYAVSLLGKEVTAAEINPLTGRLDTVTGEVTSVSLFESTGPRVYIGDRSFSLQSVMNVGKLPDNKQEPSIVTGSDLPEGKAGSEYSYILLASGTGDAALTWSITSGNLPEGLTLSADGIISGTPESEGLFSISVKVSDGDKIELTKTLSIRILEADKTEDIKLPEDDDDLHEVKQPDEADEIGDDHPDGNPEDGGG